MKAMGIDLGDRRPNRRNHASTGVLLPASMKLLGDRNRYPPRRLHWRPTLEQHIEPATQPAPTAAHQQH